MQNLQFSVFTPVTLLCENLSTTYITFNLVFYARIKHIDLDYHLIEERILNDTYQVQFLPSTNQLADIFTKGLHNSYFHLLWSNPVSPRHPSLQGSLRPP